MVRAAVSLFGCTTPCHKQESREEFLTRAKSTSTQNSNRGLQGAPAGGVTARSLDTSCTHKRCYKYSSAPHTANALSTAPVVTARSVVDLYRSLLMRDVAVHVLVAFRMGHAVLQAQVRRFPLLPSRTFGF